jgi:hypothetical protein
MDPTLPIVVDNGTGVGPLRTHSFVKRALIPVPSASSSSNVALPGPISLSTVCPRPPSPSHLPRVESRSNLAESRSSSGPTGS